jgi:histidinol-phosphate/aromatic aminotransferase/cobyric acid decarboxylase-like protein
LLHGEGSLEPLRRELEERERVLVRDCRSFKGLGADWLRLALLDRRGNRRVLGGLRRLLRVTEGGGPL